MCWYITFVCVESWIILFFASITPSSKAISTVLAINLSIKFVEVSSSLSLFLDLSLLNIVNKLGSIKLTSSGR